MFTTEQTDITWEVEKNFGLSLAIAFFLPSLALFLGSFFLIYLIERSTNVLAVLLPGVFLLTSFYFGKSVWYALKDYPQKRSFRLTAEGIFARFGESEEQFLSWGQIKQYDQEKNPGKVLFLAQAEKIRLRTEAEEEGFSVVAFQTEADLLRSYLTRFNIPFGFVRL